MNDQILSLVIECQKGIKEFREYLELCVATQKDRYVFTSKEGAKK
jgi:hypothetical protein